MDDSDDMSSEACVCLDTTPEYMGALCTVKPSNAQQMPLFQRGETVNSFLLRSVTLQSRDDRDCFDAILHSHRGTFVAVFNNMLDLASNIRWFKDFVGESHRCIVVVRDSLAHEISSSLIEVMFDCNVSCTLVQMYDSEFVGARKMNVCAIIGNEPFFRNIIAPSRPFVERPTNVEQVMRNRGFRTRHMFAIDFSR